MTDLPIREVLPADIPALASLWRRVFGDSEALISDFFTRLPQMGVGVTALADGKPVGAAYAVTGLELIDGPAAPETCGYLYAVAVEEACRGLGLGRALSLAAAEKARERGAGLICTLPAEASLYPWYQDILGVTTALFRNEERIKSRALVPCRSIDAEAYLLRRERLLYGRPHLRLSLPCLQFQHCLCLEYGGGFYAAGGGIAAAYREGDTGIIRELLCPEGEEQELASSVGAALKTERVLLYTPAEKGHPYITADPGSIPAGCVWNLSFD